MLYDVITTVRIHFKGVSVKSSPSLSFAAAVAYTLGMAERKRSSLNRVIPLGIAAVTTAFCLVAVLSAATLVARAFSALELSDMEGRIAQFGVLLRRDRESLGSLVMSYAEWSDSYDYMASRDPSYIVV